MNNNEFLTQHGAAQRRLSDALTAREAARSALDVAKRENKPEQELAELQTKVARCEAVFNAAEAECAPLDAALTSDPAVTGWKP